MSEKFYLLLLTAPSFDIRSILKAKILLSDIAKALFIGKIPILVLPSFILSLTLQSKCLFKGHFEMLKVHFQKYFVA